MWQAPNIGVVVMRSSQVGNDIGSFRQLVPVELKDFRRFVDKRKITNA